jgi:transposase-like protein
MNTLSAEKKLAVISGLVEGNSIRSISRMTGVDRNTINSLLLRTGESVPPC